MNKMSLYDLFLVLQVPYENVIIEREGEFSSSLSYLMLHHPVFSCLRSDTDMLELEMMIVSSVTQNGSGVLKIALK